MDQIDEPSEIESLISIQAAAEAAATVPFFTNLNSSVKQEEFYWQELPSFSKDNLSLANKQMIEKIHEISKELERSNQTIDRLTLRIKNQKAAFEEEKRNLKTYYQEQSIQESEVKIRELQKMFISETENIIRLFNEQRLDVLK